MFDFVCIPLAVILEVIYVTPMMGFCSTAKEFGTIHVVPISYPSVLRRVIKYGCYVGLSNVGRYAWPHSFTVIHVLVHLARRIQAFRYAYRVIHVDGNR